MCVYLHNINNSVSCIFLEFKNGGSFVDRNDPFPLPSLTWYPDPFFSSEHAKTKIVQGGK